MSVTVQQLDSTTATPQVLDRIGDVLMHGFGSDRLMQLASGESPDALRKMLRNRAKLAIDHHGLWTARVSNGVNASDSGSGVGQIMGVMVVDPPNVPSPTAFSGSKDEQFASIPPEIRKWAQESLGPAMHHLTDEAFGPTGQTESLYIHLLAVDPASRGTGVGRKLVEAAFEQADKDGVRTTLINPSKLNLTIYGKLGFTLAGQADMESPEGKHPFWAMYRDPHTP